MRDISIKRLSAFLLDDIVRRVAVTENWTKCRPKCDLRVLGVDCTRRGGLECGIQNRLARSLCRAIAPAADLPFAGREKAWSNILHRVSNAMKKGFVYPIPSGKEPARRKPARRTTIFV